MAADQYGARPGRTRRTGYGKRSRPLGGAVVDVSAQRIGVRLSGSRARDVLAKGCSIDLHPRVFVRGSAVQTTVGLAGVILLALSGRAVTTSFCWSARRSPATSPTGYWTPPKNSAPITDHLTDPISSQE